MNETNCPNCGAPVRGPHCPYCGTLHCSEKELMQMALGRRARVEFETDEGHTVCFELFIKNLGIDYRMENLYMWNGNVYQVIKAPTDVVVEGTLV